jgi:hypothetical protein
MYVKFKKLLENQKSVERISKKIDNVILNVDNLSELSEKNLLKLIECTPEDYVIGFVWDGVNWFGTIDEVKKNLLDFVDSGSSCSAIDDKGETHLLIKFEINGKSEYVFPIFKNNNLVECIPFEKMLFKKLVISKNNKDTYYYNY